MSYRIVIVTGNPSANQPVEDHLKGLHWDVFSTDNLKVAISEAASRNADFVLIAADHPSKLIRNLPKMIRKECKARLIGFSHTSTRTAINTLIEMHFENVIQPPFTGPAVEVMVKGIIQNEFKVHENNVAIALKTGSLSTGRESFAKPKAVPFPDQKTKFAELTQRALDASVSFLDDGEVETLGTNKRFAVLFVKSLKMSGYLIAALGQDRVIDTKLMTEIRNKLFESLRSEGNQMLDSDPVHLELHEVQIENWALHEARFMAKSVHQAKEIAVAFFENDSPFDVSEVQDMIKMKVSEISDQDEVQFDLYIYLPANNRLIKHTHKGRCMDSAQQFRLLVKGHAYLHIWKEDFGTAFQYAVGTKLSQKIRTFQAETAATAAVMAA